MKKIILACDTDNFSTGVFDFLQDLHQSEPFLLTGIFLHSVNDDMFLPRSVTMNNPVVAYSDEDVKAVARSIQKFTDRCLHAGIEYRVHEESEAFKIEEVVKESRFADLMVLSEELFFAHIDKNQPNRYMKQVFHKCECPIIVVPEHNKGIHKIAFAYDGSRESMFSIKQFCYLFPTMLQLPASIFYWVDESDEDVPDMIYIEEYAARHLSNLKFKNMFFDKTKYLSFWAEDKKDTMIVCGSYSRSGLSGLFRKSFVDDLIKNPSSVIFIAHTM